MTLTRLAGPGAAIDLLPDDAPFSPEQRAWLSGFVLALLEAGGAAAETRAPALPIAVLFASQTGTAERLARKLARAAKGRGFAATARDIGELTLPELAGLGHAVVIAATHGEGEPPDTALSVSRALAEAEGEALAGLRYAVLALGDSSYLKFCAYGAFLDERFAALGGERLVERVDCDGDPDAPFGAWRDSVLDLVAEETGAAAPGDAGASAGDDDDAPGDAPGSRGNPLAATVVDNRALTSGASDREVRHIALTPNDIALVYEPGDALGVVVSNPPEMVAAVLAATGFDGGARVSLEGGPTLAEALAHRLSIGRLTQPTVIKFAAAAKDPELSALLEPERNQALAGFLHGRDLIDLLVRYPGALESPRALVAMLPALAPRVYSIASSLKAHPGEVHLTVALVRYASHGRDRVGIASSFLAERAAPGPVRIYLQSNSRFRLPEDPATPVIMIGPGTGIAPFRAFLHERRAIGAAGPSWLFFGDRHAASDFLYRDELEGFRKDGTLSRLDLAFSRDQPEKVYVQHRMLESAAELWGWLRDGAHLYVCGDADRMAKDVHQALRIIFARQGRMSEAQAALEVDQLAAQRRYLRDVY